MNFDTHYQPVAAASQLIEGKLLSVWYNQKPFVLVKNQGKITAFQNYCPHRGVPLSKGFVSMGEINCPYHGWRFDCETGENTFAPVKNAKVHCQLKSIFVLEKYDLIWLSSKKEALLPALYEQIPNVFTLGNLNASLPNAIENFLEGSHTHYIHDGLVRSQHAQRQKIKAKIVPNAQGFQVFYETEKAKGFVTKILPQKYRNLCPVATYIYPNVAILAYFNPQNELIARFEGIMSEGKAETIFFARIFLQVGIISPILAFLGKYAFQKIITQDKNILEIQTENTKLFPENKFFSDETDIVGQQIFAWLYNPHRVLQESVEFEVYW